MGQVTRGYAAAATALLLLSGASSFGKLYIISSVILCVEHNSMTCKEMSCQASIIVHKKVIGERQYYVPIETAWRSSYPDGRGIYEDLKHILCLSKVLTCFHKK